MMAHDPYNDIKGMLDMLTSFYSNMHSQMLRSDRLYHRDFNNLMSLPEDTSMHESSSAAQIVDGHRDQINTAEPAVEYVVAGKGKEFSIFKNTIETWGKNALLLADDMSDTIPVSQQSAHNLLLRGAACRKIVVPIESIPEPPLRTKFKTVSAYNKAVKLWEEAPYAWPYAVKDLDPVSVLVSPGSYTNPTYTIERSERRWLDIYETYGEGGRGDNAIFHDKAGKDKGLNPMRLVKWTECWTKSRYIVEVDDERIIDKPNPYGIHPYVWAFSGLGRADADGDPAHLAKSILTDVAGEIEDEVRIKTAQTIQWLLHVFSRLITTEDPKKARSEMMKGPGGIITVRTMAEKPEFLNTPAPNPQMLIFLQEIQQNIARKAPSAMNERPPGVDAAIHQALLIGQAGKIIAPVKRALNIMAAKTLDKMAFMAKTLDLRMGTTGVTGEDGNMIKGNEFEKARFRVTYEVTDPVENDRRMLTGLALLRLPEPLISKQTWREQYGKGVIPDNEEEEVRILSENLFNQLMSSGILLQAVMAELQQREQAAGINKSVSNIRGGVEDVVSGTPGGTQPGGVARGVEEAAGSAPLTFEPGQEAASGAGVTAGAPGPN
jgi:hypothetical protein